MTIDVIQLTNVFALLYNQQYSIYIGAIRFNGEGSQSSWRRP